MILVSTLTDEDDADHTLGDLSLREAVGLAETNAGVDTIVFHYSLLNQTIVLSLGEIAIESDVTIKGPGAGKLTVSGNNTSRVFRTGVGTSVTIADVTMTNGYTTNKGGAIYSDGDLVLDNVVIRDSEADNSSGGAVYSLKGDLTVLASTIENNLARWDAGISKDLNDNRELLVFGSSIVGNTQTDNGGGRRAAVAVTAWGANPGTAKILNSTIAGNHSYAGSGLGTQGAVAVEIVNATITDNVAISGGAGIWNLNNAATIYLHNSIVAGNRKTNGIYNDISGQVHSSSSHNIIGTYNQANLVDGQHGNHIGITTPGVTTLGDYGGENETMALLDGSLAIDGGDNAIAAAYGLLFDQRGEWRVTDGDDDGIATVDIGAFELGADEFFGTL